MNDLIPIGKVLKENPRVQELEEQGFIIKPEKLDSYLEDFKERKSTLPDKDYWKGKIVYQVEPVIREGDIENRDEDDFYS